MAVRRRAKGSGRRGLRLLALAAAALLACAGLLAVYAERTLSRLVVGGLGVAFSTKVYSAPFELGGARRQAPWRVVDRLIRLGYRPAARPSAPGQYAWSAPTLTVYLRGFLSPMARQEPGLFVLEASPDGLWTIASSGGSAEPGAAARPGRPKGTDATPGEPAAYLEPEVMAELSGPRKIRREPARWEDIPERLRDAVVAAEDKRFYSHWGIDPRAVLRSLWYDATRRGVYGGSTITQQLAKNLFLTPRRTLLRKAAEAALAFYLELRYSKNEILTLYLNHIYLGQDGATSIAGVKAAARFYFGKDLKELDLADCALLAGVIRSPYLYNPFRDPAAAKERREFVLGRMLADGRITRREFAAAAREPVRSLRSPVASQDEYAYFTAEVVRGLLPRYPEDELFRLGLSIYTTADPMTQRAAARAARLTSHEAAIVALDAASGGVEALVGGRRFSESQFNRATQARRQPGSAFKPFVYGAALERGFTSATSLADEPRRYPRAAARPEAANHRGKAGSLRGGAEEYWEPANYDGIYLGTVTLRQALARSLNGATLDLARRVGPPAIIDFARRLGISSPLGADLGLALGTSEVGLLELTAAYAPFANGGFRVAPRLVTAVADADGNVLEFHAFDREPVLTPALAYLMTSLLESVVVEGTAGALGRRYGWTRPAAGKTGTTNDGRDAWFIGYTPELLAGAWVGEDSDRAIHATGAKDALPLWAAFVKGALPSADPCAGDRARGSVPCARPEAASEGFQPPQGGLATVRIDPLSGLLAVAGCPESRKEIFLAGTEPARYCPLHRRGLVGWFKRLFGSR